MGPAPRSGPLGSLRDPTGGPPPKPSPFLHRTGIRTCGQRVESLSATCGIDNGSLWRSCGITCGAPHPPGHPRCVDILDAGVNRSLRSCWPSVQNVPNGVDGSWRSCSSPVGPADRSCITCGEPTGKKRDFEDRVAAQDNSLCRSANSNWRLDSSSFSVNAFRSPSAL